MKNNWSEIENIIEQSNRKITVFNGNYETGKKECHELHIPSDSVLSSIVIHSNGIIVDNWIRIFGQDSSSNNGVLHYNKKNAYSHRISGMFLVACDVLGGLYAININRFSNKRNMLWYFGPDTLEWECIEMMYNKFVAWSIQGNTDDFYSSMHWKKWKNDVENISINSAIFVYPFLWSNECNLETATKKIINIDELIKLNFECSDSIHQPH